MRILLVVGVIVFSVHKTKAQSTSFDSSFVTRPIQQDTSQKKHVSLYLKIFAGVGELLSNNKHLSQSLSVPYTSTVAGYNMLTVNKNNLVGNNFLMLGGGLEIGIGKFFVTVFPQGLISNSRKYGTLPNGSGEFSLGINLPVSYNKKQFTLQLASALYSIDYDISLGQINNSNATIDILGEQANPTFHVKSNAKSGPWNYTGMVNATQLNVGYSNNQLYLAPKIGICSNTLRSKFHWGFYVMYNFPIYKDEYFSLSQDGTVSGHDVTFGNYLSKVRISHADAILLNNGIKSTSTPNIASGFAFMFTVGYNFINGINGNKKSKK